MSIVEIILIALGLSMDAFAVSICLGLNMKKASLKKMMVVGLYFGGFQALMPLAGYLIANLFAERIIAFDHWIAFGLLLILGTKMLLGAFEKENGGCEDRTCKPEPCTDRECPVRSAQETSLAPLKMLPFAIATSIDALAVGVLFALAQAEIGLAVGLIGVITLILSMAGVKIGNIFGRKLKAKAEFIGGLILILMGVKILLEHLGVINF